MVGLLVYPTGDIKAIGSGSLLAWTSDYILTNSLGFRINTLFCLLVPQLTNGYLWKDVYLVCEMSFNQGWHMAYHEARSAGQDWPSVNTMLAPMNDTLGAHVPAQRREQDGQHCLREASSDSAPHRFLYLQELKASKGNARDRGFFLTSAICRSLIVTWSPFFLLGITSVLSMHLLWILATPSSLKGVFWVIMKGDDRHLCAEGRLGIHSLSK